MKNFLRVAYIDFEFHTKTLEEHIDFYVFNPYLRNLEVSINRFVISPSLLELYPGVTVLSDLTSIKNYDEIILFSVPPDNEFKMLLENNNILKLRLTRQLKKNQNLSPKFSTIFSKDRAIQSKLTTVFHVPLCSDFSFIKDLDKIYHKDAIVIYTLDSNFDSVKNYVDLFVNVEKIAKNDFKLIIIGPFSRRKDDLKGTGYSIEFIPYISIANFAYIFESSLLFLDLSSTISNTVRNLAYRYECVYYSNVNINDRISHNLGQLNSTEIRKLLMVSHFRDRKIENQTMELEHE